MTYLPCIFFRINKPMVALLIAFSVALILEVSATAASVSVKRALSPTALVTKKRAAKIVNPLPTVRVLIDEIANLYVDHPVSLEDHILYNSKRNNQPLFVPQITVTGWESKSEYIPTSVYRTLYPRPMATGKSRVSARNHASEERGFSQIMFTNIVGASEISRVFAIAGLERYWIAKYSGFCGDTDLERKDTALNEAKYLKLLEPTGVANRLLYISNAVETPYWLINRKGKVNLRQCRDYRSSPIRTIPTVRYMISSRVGITIHGLMTEYGLVQSGVDSVALGNQKVMPFFRAVKLAREMLRLVKTIAHNNVVHNDLHYDNVGFQEVYLDRRQYVTNDQDNRLLLIDFGRAITITPEELAARPEKDPRITQVSCHGNFSPWTSFGQPVSFRDDLYLVLHSLATMLYGEQYWHVVGWICGKHTKPELRAYLEFQFKHSIFDVTVALAADEPTEPAEVYEYRLVNVLPPGVIAHVEEIKRAFSLMLYSVRQTRPNQKPDYDYVDAQLQRILDFETLALDSVV